MMTYTYNSSTMEGVLKYKDHVFRLAYAHNETRLKKCNNYNKKLRGEI